MWKRAQILLVGLLLVSVFAGSMSVQAATPTTASPDGLGVSPALVTLATNTHDNQLTFTNVVTNDSNNLVHISASTTDFTMTGTNGDVLFADAGSSAHGLASQMIVDQPNFVIEAHQTKTVTVTIIDTNSLRAGGHYGAVLYKVDEPSPATGNKSRVSIHKTVASLVFVTTTGQGTYKLSLLPIDNPIALFHLPHSYNLTFHNDGNTQATPEGYVQVSGPLQKLYSRGTINSGSALVLPGTSRLLNTPVTRVTHAWLPGKYTVTTYYRPAGSNVYQQKSTSFWYFNFGSIICIIILFIIIRAWWKRHAEAVKSRILSTMHRIRR